MSDPTGGVAKIATEMAREVQNAAKAEELAQPPKTSSVEFQNVLNTQPSQGLGQSDATHGTADVLRAATQAQRTVSTPAMGQSLDTHALRSGFERLMGEVASGQNKLESLMHLCLSGKNFSSQELLALQAGVYRFTQELELTSKVVEKSTAALKQTLSTQV